jgi:hypothetical protein
MMCTLLCLARRSKPVLPSDTADIRNAKLPGEIEMSEEQLMGAQVRSLVPWGRERAGTRRRPMNA